MNSNFYELGKIRLNLINKFSCSKIRKNLYDKIDSTHTPPYHKLVIKYLNSTFFSKKNVFSSLKDKKKAELLSLMIFCKILVILAILFYAVDFATNITPFALSSLFATTLFYLLSRTQYSIWALRGTNYADLIVISLTILKFGGIQNVTLGPPWMVIGIIISSLFASFKEVSITVLITFFTLLFLLFHVPSDLFPIMLGMIIFVSAVSLLILVSAVETKKIKDLLKQEHAKTAHISKLTSLGEMAGGMAHEINNPMAAIIGSVHIINRKYTAIDDDLKKRITVISENANKVAKIVSSLRVLVKDAEDEDQHIVNLSDVINETLDLCAGQLQEENIELVCNM